MKKLLLIAAVLALAGQTPAQDARTGPDFHLPLTITIFTESIGLPNFRFAEGQTNLGFRIGNELYYKNSGKALRQNHPADLR